MKKIMPIILMILFLPACGHSQSLAQTGKVPHREPTGPQPGNKITFKQASPEIRKALGLEKGDLLLSVRSDGSNILFFEKSRREFKEGPVPLGRTLRGFVTIFSTNFFKCQTIDIAGRRYWYPGGCP